MNIQQFGSEKLPSIIKDPFNKTSVDSIWVRFGKSAFDDNWNAHGAVKFINGNTKGEQDFTGKTFDEVVLKIKSFMEEILDKDK